MDLPIRFGLCGAGSFGPQFARYINEFAKLVAFCEPNEESRRAFQLESGLPAYQSHREMLSSESLDAVAITSPNFTHAEIAIDAAQQGKHVFCEKAMATTVDECRRMVAACENADVRLMVGHKRRLRPPWQRMVQLRERLGAVRAITACAYYDARPYDHQGWWTKRELCGGTLSVIGVHVIDWMRAMCGDVVNVRGLAAPQTDPRYDFPDTLHVSIKFRSGAIGSLNVSMVYPVMKFREAAGPLVVCAEGGMRFVPRMEHLDLYWQHHNDSQPNFERFDDLGFEHAYRQEFGDFVRWISDGVEPCMTWEEGLKCVEVMEAALKSADAGGKVIEL